MYIYIYTFFVFQYTLNYLGAVTTPRFCGFFSTVMSSRCQGPATPLLPLPGGALRVVVPLK